MKLDKRILPNIKKTNKFCFKNKTPELWQARRDLELYYKENRLDPTKNWTRDPIHGEKVLKLIRRLNFELDKISSKYPLTDSRKMKTLKEKASKIAEGKIAKGKKAAAEEKEAKKGRTATKYDYPLIDGREMTSVEKKKYRQEQRNKAAGKVKPEKKEKPSKKAETKAEPKKEAKAKKAESTKKVKKVKKVKEED